ncbi:monooxygenase [Actinosynnema sp. ALI-1.44]|uniref:FAD-dependent oxidoreductase n=1 Tax=Actinosynnema sp. ALI-1.44 TaxID=1933779 RepID=UPI00097C7287|nr:NAD(P)/FAD-dependent oxidoreductase [Actinosynnema sp. ALI-1.44]ONI77884.1 monooxygenase [Actinosynnema sp. ALI-1.44]
MGRVRVVVIGGGIGGLCLAQGLRQAGVDVTVYEQDSSPRGRSQGYRLRISPEGERALRDCLPPRVRDLLVATANVRYDSQLVAYDENLVEQWAPTFTDPRGEAPEKVDAVDRGTLRRVLLAGLDQSVHFGRQCTRVERRADGQVVAYFADGTRAVGDVLVAADGTNSRIRAQLRPGDVPRDLGVRTVFSRISRAAVTAADVPPGLRDRFSYVIGSDGYHLGLMPMIFRTRPDEAAARWWPGLPMDDVDDYYMSVFNVHRTDLGIDDETFFAMSGTRLCELVLERTAGWHPGLRGVVRHAQPDMTFAVALRATMPVQPWDQGNLVGLGDAVHTMPPSGGVGANTAVCDASVLCRVLTEVDRGERDLPDALADYYRAMVVHASQAVAMSLRIAQWSIKKLDVPVPDADAGKPR